MAIGVTTTFRPTTRSAAALRSGEERARGATSGCKRLDSPPKPIFSCAHSHRANSRWPKPQKHRSELRSVLWARGAHDHFLCTLSHLAELRWPKSPPTPTQLCCGVSVDSGRAWGPIRSQILSNSVLKDPKFGSFVSDAVSISVMFGSMATKPPFQCAAQGCPRVVGGKRKTI